MNDYGLGEIETKFAEIIWENEPITSTELSKKSEELLGWKKSTSYTVLKRLCDKGLFENVGGTVRSLITKEEYSANRSRAFINGNYNGSLPSFVASFIGNRTLSAKDADEIRRMIDEYRKEIK